MVQQVEKIVELETTLEVKPDYDLHIKVQAEVRSVLKDSAQLAYKMGDIPKSDLIDLMNLFIGWGLTIQKKKMADEGHPRKGARFFIDEDVEPQLW